jgi:transcription elongation GreA/GreB family factor
VLSWACSATALAAITACGGGGGGGDNTPPANAAPTISIDTPTASQTFASGAAIAIAATAADSDGTITKVEFFADGTKIGEDTTAPYSFNWTGATAGAHTITASAIDDAGATALSASRSITVSAPPSPPPPPPPPPANQLPTTSITSPATGFKPNAPAAVALAATAADADGTIAKVEFFRVNPAAPVFDATTLVGQATAVGTPPSYQFTTSALAAGTYNFVARATDNAGGVGTSASVQVIVNALPTVSITAPAANAVVQVGSTVTLRANAADTDGSVAKVEFFNGTTLLGQGTRVGTTNEYTYAWASFPAGPKSVTARATDNDNATQTTASLALNANGQPTVTLDDPTAGTNAPTTLVLAAAATDADGTIASVQFFNGTTLLGSGTFDAATSRYRLSVPIGATQNGTYTITARATDNNGGITTTASKSVTIAANVPPVATMTSAATFTLPATVLLTATASDSDGIAKVEFFNGTTKLGEDTTAPYTFTWTAATAGTYSITARATDTVGSVGNSAAQSVTVNPDSAGMWSALTAEQRAGITTAPDVAIDDQYTDAVNVMTALGVTQYIPSFAPAMGFAARRLAEFIPTTTAPITCPGGGTVSAAANGANLLLNYNNCVIDGFTFFGGAGMGTYVHIDTTTPAPPFVHPSAACLGTYSTAAPAGYRCAIPSSVDYFPAEDRLALSGLRVTGNGAPEPGGESYPRNAYSNTGVDCSGTGASKVCLTNVNNNHLWGTNVSWAGWTPGTLLPATSPLYATDDTYIVNGTYRSLYTGAAARNIRFEAMTNNSGRAVVYGSNGYSVATRLAPSAPGVERLSIVRTIVTQVTGGPPVGTSPAVIASCSVSAAQGEWVCVPAL